MATATYCNFESQVIDVSEALLIDAVRKVAPFSCIECGLPVWPHQSGGHVPAHFEHYKRNKNCSLSHKKRRKQNGTMLIDTKTLAAITAGGDSYIRTKDGEVKGLALRRDLNELAPEIVVVGRGPQIERRAKLLLAINRGVPTYIKKNTNSWEYFGEYRATSYKTSAQTIAKYRGNRPVKDVAGILFLEAVDRISVNVSGGGFPDPETRREVEKAAVLHVMKTLESDGFLVEDRQRNNCGYDLRVYRGHEEFFYEVKGTDANVARFFITRNEKKHSEAHDNWRLAIVTSARSAPKLEVWSPSEMNAHFEFDGLVWECTLKSN